MLIISNRKPLVQKITHNTESYFLIVLITTPLSNPTSLSSHQQWRDGDEEERAEQKRLPGGPTALDMDTIMSAIKARCRCSGCACPPPPHPQGGTCRLYTGLYYGRTVSAVLIGIYWCVWDCTWLSVTHRPPPTLTVYITAFSLSLVKTSGINWRFEC